MYQVSPTTRVLAALAGMATSGCLSSLASPRPRALLDGAPRAILPGETEVRPFAGAEIGGVEGTYGGLGGGLAFGHGFTADWAVDVEARLQITYSDHWLASSRGGVRWAPNPHLNLGAGLGIGALDTAGGFLGPDAGVSVGYHNPYVTPYVNGAVGVSLPFASTDFERRGALGVEDYLDGTGRLQPNLFLVGATGIEFASDAPVSFFLQAELMHLSFLTDADPPPSTGPVVGARIGLAIRP